MGKLTRADWAVLLVSAPVMALAISWLATVALGLAWHHPVWNTEPRNLSEAAAFRDGGTIVRRIRAGEDPAVAAEVRPGFISSTPMTVTPLEAAVQARRPEIVRLLLDLGTKPDASSWRRAWCATQDEGTKALLEPYRPVGAARDCTEARER